MRIASKGQFLAIFGFFLFVIAVVGPTFTASADEVGKDKVIAAYYPPLMIEPDGEQPGLSIEILREAAKRLGRETSIEFLPFRRALKTLRHSNKALQPALYRNPTREPHYQWIVHVNDVVDVFLTLETPVNSLDEARKLTRIGVETDASMDILLTKLGFTNLERVDSPNTNAEKLRAGRIEAWALTRSLAQWTWKRLGYQETLVVGAPIRTAPVYLVAGLAYPKPLAAAYRESILEMKADGTVERILSRYW